MKPLTLDCTHIGDRVEIVSVDDAHARIQALRFGINPGAIVTIAGRVPAGPIVVKSGYQEIAIGRPLARKIQVKEYRHKPSYAGTPSKMSTDVK